ncbi:LysR family transcriptional regulator [Haemophilus paracuniculus]|uniref:LysR family transcriptional regulator n=1 Tax=Haemophilus paracuniculus TaxID=734 RepID=A0A1T0AQ97_9PAST|nr:LysR family transcriptional regulator [Haemophilus paracuniculus]OOR98312.1 LysR family transcriptional regulator [Haemophilus paracuniculus]
MDKLTSINVFLTLAELGSYTATADKLDMSRAMVSRHIDQMEEWLNARLFQRTTRVVKITEAGEQAVRYCQQITDLVQEVEQEVSAQSGELVGVLRLASSISFGANILSEAINEFQQLHPKLKIHLNLGDQAINLIENRIDLAIRITNNPDPSLVARKLSRCRSLLVATPDYLAQHGIPTTLDELRSHRCLAHANVNRTEWYFRQGEQQQTVELDNAFTANDALALCNIALASGGIAMLPRYMVNPHLESGRLQAVLTDWDLPEYTLYALYPSRHKLPLMVRTFLDFLVEQFAEKGW